MAVDYNNIPIIHKALVLPNPLLEEHAGIWLIKPGSSDGFNIYVVTETTNDVWEAIPLDRSGNIDVITTNPSGAPGSNEPSIAFNTADGSFWYWDGTNWVEIESGSNYTGSEGIKIVGTDIQTEFTSDLDDGLETVAVGGLPAGALSLLKGQSLRKIIEDMVAPTLNPTLTPPSMLTFTVSPSATPLEVGSTHNLTFTATFSRGSITPEYTSGSNYRSGDAISYVYTGQVLAGTDTHTGTTHTKTANGVVIAPGNNTWTALVNYSAGVQPKNNKGGDFGTPLAAGATASISRTLVGIYPYFWMKSSSPITPEIMQTAIESGSATKVVAASTGNISIGFNATGEYLAVAYPATSTTKTKWFVNALDNGDIPGGVFGGQTTLPCNSSTSLWTNIDYKIHVSPGLITQASAIQLQN